MVIEARHTDPLHRHRIDPAHVNEERVLTHIAAMRGKMLLLEQAEPLTKKGARVFLGKVENGKLIRTHSLVDMSHLRRSEFVPIREKRLILEHNEVLSPYVIRREHRIGESDGQYKGRASIHSKELRLPRGDGEKVWQILHREEGTYIGQVDHKDFAAYHFAPKEPHMSFNRISGNGKVTKPADPADFVRIVEVDISPKRSPKP